MFVSSNLGVLEISSERNVQIVNGDEEEKDEGVSLEYIQTGIYRGQQI